MHLLCFGFFFGGVDSFTFVVMKLYVTVCQERLNHSPVRANRQDQNLAFDSTFGNFVEGSRLTITCMQSSFLQINKYALAEASYL